MDDRLQTKNGISIRSKIYKVMENCKQYRSFLPVGTFDIIATKFIWLSTKINNMQYLLIIIYPAVKFQMWSFNIFWVIVESRFHCFRFYNNHVLVYLFFFMWILFQCVACILYKIFQDLLLKVSSMHYHLIGIYRALKF